ncbi:MAG: hypothetical protein ABSG68_11210 [Thermoguttaceae bacterium]
MIFSTASLVTKCSRLLLTWGAAFTSVKGFSTISFLRTAARKNCRARFTFRPMVAGASFMPTCSACQSSASPGVMSASIRPSPKKLIRLRLVAL